MVACLADADAAIDLLLDHPLVNVSMSGNVRHQFLLENKTVFSLCVGALWPAADCGASECNRGGHTTGAAPDRRRRRSGRSTYPCKIYELDITLDAVGLLGMAAGRQQPKITASEGSQLFVSTSTWRWWCPTDRVTTIRCWRGWRRRIPSRRPLRNCVG